MHLTGKHRTMEVIPLDWRDGEMGDPVKWRETDRQADTQTDIQTDRLTERDRDRQSETDTKKDRVNGC